MILYERFYNLCQESRSVEDYMEEFNNLSASVGLSESSEQLTMRYLAGLQTLVSNELGVRIIMMLEEAYMSAF